MSIDENAPRIRFYAAQEASLALKVSRGELTRQTLDEMFPCEPETVGRICIVAMKIIGPPPAAPVAKQFTRWLWLIVRTETRASKARWRAFRQACMEWHQRMGCCRPEGCTSGMERLLAAIRSAPAKNARADQSDGAFAYHRIQSPLTGRP